MRTIPLRKRPHKTAPERMRGLTFPTSPNQAFYQAPHALYLKLVFAVCQGSMTTRVTMDLNRAFIHKWAIFDELIAHSLSSFLRN